MNGWSGGECWWRGLGWRGGGGMIFYCGLCGFGFCGGCVGKEMGKRWERGWKWGGEGLGLEKVIGEYKG